MSHFVYDLVPMSIDKADLSPIPTGADPKYYIQAVADWIPLVQAALDIRDVLLGARFYGLGAQSSDPAPSGTTTYLWLRSDDSLMLHTAGANNALLSGGRQILTDLYSGLQGGGTLNADLNLAIRDLFDSQWIPQWVGMEGGPWNYFQLNSRGQITRGELKSYVETSRTISGTSGRITGGGDLSANRSFDLAQLDPSPAGSYNTADITVDVYGRVTAAASGISSPLTAKGDLYTCSSAGPPVVPAALTVGTNGQFLTANSATTTGLEWITLTTVKDLQASYDDYTAAPAKIILDSTRKGLLIQDASPTLGSGETLLGVLDTAGTGTYFCVMGDGKVGVGTASPSTALHVVGVGGGLSGVTVQYSAPDITLANATILDNDSPNARIIAKGPNTSTYGGFYIQLQRSDQSGHLEPLTIANTGITTFAQQVRPSADNTYSLGASATNRWSTIFAASFNDGTNTISTYGGRTTFRKASAGVTEFVISPYTVQAYDSSVLKVYGSDYAVDTANGWELIFDTFGASGSNPGWSQLTNMVNSTLICTTNEGSTTGFHDTVLGVQNLSTAVGGAAIIEAIRLHAATTPEIDFFTNKMVIDSAGKVCVNTTTPSGSAFLTVNGTIVGTQATATTEAVMAGRSVSAGTGLSGGGDLTANRTLSLDQAVIPTWTGAHTFTGGVTFKNHSAFAGSGFIPETRAIQTTTVTPAVLWSKTLADDTLYWVEVRVIGRDIAGVERAYYGRTFYVYRQSAGSATLGTVIELFSEETDADWDVGVNVNTNDVEVKVTGKNSVTINWAGTVTMQAVSGNT